MALTTRKIAPGRAPIYHKKAEMFEASARRLLQARQYDPAVSSAVHALISALDGLFVERLGQRSSAEDHGETTGLLGELKQIPGSERDAFARHADRLLGMKHLAEYEDRLVTEQEARQALVHLERAMVILRRWRSARP